jgi:hypothetical protein
LPPLQTRTPDVQAALTVLGRGEFATPLDLHGTDLRSADLIGASLRGARLARHSIGQVLLAGGLGWAAWERPRWSRSVVGTWEASRGVLTPAR